MCIKTEFLWYYFYVAKSQMARWHINDYINNDYVNVINSIKMRYRGENSEQTENKKDEKLTSQNNR